MHNRQMMEDESQTLPPSARRFIPELVKYKENRESNL
jgi:hypothetical protein